ncbi:MAG: DUF3786 domain-containing protein [Chloroflexota bacterium]
MDQTSTPFISKNTGGLERRLEEYRLILSSQNPKDVARRSGAELTESGWINFMLYDEVIAIDARSFQPREPIDDSTLALILAYLSRSDGSPPCGQWISFRELDDGTFYHQAFQGYTGRPLVDHLANDLARLTATATEIGGRQSDLGDISFIFDALPRVPILLIYWRGDDEFKASAKILFDRWANHHLPTDGCAVMGSTLVRLLINR